MDQQDIKEKIRQTEVRWRSIKARFKDYGLCIDRYSPGNGHSKYRIFNNPVQRYFNYMPGCLICTVTGIGLAEQWIGAFERGILHERSAHAKEEASLFDVPPKEEYEPNA